MSFRCCTHCSCADDGDLPDRHGQSCGGDYGVCSTGGDEWVDEGDVYDSDDAAYCDSNVCAWGDCTCG